MHCTHSHGHYTQHALQACGREAYSLLLCCVTLSAQVLWEVIGQRQAHKAAIKKYIFVYTHQPYIYIYIYIAYIYIYIYAAAVVFIIFF